MNNQEIIAAFDKRLKQKHLSSLQEVLPLCESSITNFHIAITTIAQSAIKELLQLLTANGLDYATAVKQGLIDIAFSLLIARFNSVLDLDYPYIVAIVQEKNRLGVCLKAIQRKDIRGLRESTRADIIPFIVIDVLVPGPLLNFKTETFKYLNYNDEALPTDPQP